MDTNITNFKITSLKSDKFIKLFSVEFTQNGVNRTWDCIDIHDSVSVLLYHKSKNAFLLVKQFRPPLWHYQMKNGIKSDEPGFSYELCSGIMDKGIDAKQTAIEEVEEETGFRVSNLQHIITTYASFGVSSNKQSLFFAFIDDDMKVSNGGGIDDESIELVYIEKNKAMSFAYDESKAKAASLIFAFMWFFENNMKSA
ncbi:NUDIX domain-containing protein [Campylobacter sputorum subsp. bubulus]|uniref:NUDIX domain-containing protein n=1 Tax=Campylobacter sputorum subsp. sputorum TaxID=32024 RepID=A0A381DIG8_9BACT|nr:NUDIX hydrolase [Campylobacter sputorum]ASM35518.1 nudix-type nucleoside diphosphatase [Campylobacter sputorum aubsp. sputorum RM3237]KAB0582748.1 NUDIX hydrolase [Campylobacter sputorum subsp. sputorum]QEL05710.1 Nudix-type nucleoside diphosphatase, YffH/AdpP family [Campylobacter sputorum subsp. sputorum]SUX08256.1 NUDIX domain-containing protein [Campylobacter sputorum subsp. bubulus]SUX10479.1 NUDIX domain-containing protein [Campylobacter sputorum subsp. sputorum]